MTITKTEFKEELQQLTSEELRLFIISLYGNNVDVADDFIIWKNNQKQAQQSTEKPLESQNVDKKVIQTIHKKINNLLIDPNDADYTYYGELVFDEQLEGFENLLAEFQQQPMYLIAIATYWVDELITHFDDYLWETDLENSISTAYAVIAEVIFDDDDYYASWSDNFYPCQSHVEQTMIDNITVNIKDWLAHGKFTDDVGRLWFDFLVATGQTDTAMAWLDECIYSLTIQITQNSYHEYKLVKLLLLKIQFLQHLEQHELSEQVMTDYIHIKKIRDVQIRSLLVDDKITEAINLIHQVIEGSDNPNDVEEWQEYLVEIAELHNLPELLIENIYNVAFHKYSARINTTYFTKWKNAHIQQSTEQWHSVRASEQQKLLAIIEQRTIDVSNQDNLYSYDNNTDELKKLAHFYVIEQQHDELVTLIKKYPTNHLLDSYLEIVATHADSDFIRLLVQKFINTWNASIDGLSTRKAYASMATDITETVKRLPQGSAEWQKMVAQWEVTYKRKPALLDEISKITWS